MRVALGERLGRARAGGNAGQRRSGGVYRLLGAGRSANAATAASLSERAIALETAALAATLALHVAVGGNLANQAFGAATVKLVMGNSSK